MSARFSETWIDTMLASLPPAEAARLREQVCRVLEHIIQMKRSGADIAAVRAYIRSDEAWT